MSEFRIWTQKQWHELTVCVCQRSILRSLSGILTVFWFFRLSFTYCFFCVINVGTNLYYGWALIGNMNCRKSICVYLLCSMNYIWSATFTRSSTFSKNYNLLVGNYLNCWRALIGNVVCCKLEMYTHYLPCYALISIFSSFLRSYPNSHVLLRFHI